MLERPSRTWTDSGNQVLVRPSRAYVVCPARNHLSSPVKSDGIPPRPLVNGVALANKDKISICLGSDGSFQEGNDAEAARLAVAQNLNVKVSHCIAIIAWNIKD
jgi:hypothetical protein